MSKKKTAASISTGLKGFFKHNSDTNKTSGKAMEKAPTEYSTGNEKKKSVVSFKTLSELAYGISSAHFCPSIKEYLNARNGKSSSALTSDLVSEIEKFSALYKDIHTVKQYSDSLHNKIEKRGSLTVLKKNTHLGEFVIDVIESCKDTKNVENKYHLTLRSPVGSYKNRLLQYIYLYLYHKGQKDGADTAAVGKAAALLPVYVDLSTYENGGTAKCGKCGELNVTSLLAKLGEIVEDASGINLAPVIIFDNIRSFSCGIEKAYNEINSFVMNGANKCHIVAGVDTLTATTNRTYLGELAKDKNYTNVIKISSLNLDRESEAIEFIDNCLKICQCDISDAQDLREKLIQLKFVALDAYIIKKILKYMETRSLVGINTDTLSKIYAFYLPAHIDDNCFKEAYLYDYDDSIDVFPEMSKWWGSVIEHRSFFDYFVAKHYYNCLKKVLDSGGEAALPDVVLTDSVNRFLRSMMTKKEWISLVDFVHGNIEKFSATAKGAYGEKTIAQLIFLVGRVPSIYDRDLKRSNSIEEVLCLLKAKFEEVFSSRDMREPEDLKINYFLLRTIQVDLIKRGNMDILNEYLTTLISDEIAAEVNIGYHLDYYGDITLEERHDVLSSIGVVLTDLKQKGVNSLRKLSLKLEHDFNCGAAKKEKFCMLTLNLFTYCELIMSRKFSRSFDHMPNHKEKCLYFLNCFFELIDGDSQGLDPCIIKSLSATRDLLERNLNKNPRYLELIDGLNKTRTGWQERDVPNAESIAAHMYNAWLLAMIYLPEEYEGEADLSGVYNKEKILNLLLIHDVGEAMIGDIVPEKKSVTDKEREKSAEETYVKLIFPYSTAEELVSLWNASESKGSNDINARIAKDIDHIQAVYQYCYYVTTKSDMFKPDDWNEWTKSMLASTKMGMKIVYDAILDNAEFMKNKTLAKHINVFKESLKGAGHAKDA